MTVFSIKTAYICLCYHENMIIDRKEAM
jgi:hypothetical protein